MDPVLGRLGLGDALEEQPRPGPVGVDPGGVPVPVLTGQVVGHGPRLPAVGPVGGSSSTYPIASPQKAASLGGSAASNTTWSLMAMADLLLGQRCPSPARAPGSVASSAAAAPRTHSTRRVAGEAAVDRDLDPEPVEQGGQAPGGGVRVGAGELAGGHPLADHRGQGLLPAQVELARHLGQLGAAQGLAPGVDPEQPRPSRTRRGSRGAGSGRDAGRRCPPRRRSPTAGPGPRRRRTGRPPRAGSPCW